jgi:ATP-dependent DNA helicase RecQ
MSDEALLAWHACYESLFAMEAALEEVLRSRFGLAEFRPWQREAIDALLGAPGRVLVVAPTGGGKSLTYQLPAALLDGTTLVLSPLVALMEDQVRALTARGIPATFLASTLEPSERYEREAGMMRGKYRLVYAAPERLASSAFVDLLARCDVSLVAIDEAHCITQWGHDFRPDYLRIGKLLERLRPKRILACTATATPLVRDEIKKHLRLEDCHEVLRGFARPNLHLSARHVDGAKDARRALLDQLAASIGSGGAPRGAAIVYCATRKKTEEVAALLRDHDYDAHFYHAGMSGDARTRVANAFSARETDIVVATNAFGMGIDRPDIRAVVHMQPPSSIEAYYQEVGRAGRDGAEAHGLLLCSGADISLRRRLVTTGSDGQPAEPDAAARAWSLFRDLLRYLDARTCRHDFVLRYFGDEHELLGGCGHCDVCEAVDDASPEGETEETTLVVKKALSAVARAQKRGGIVAIAEMLSGVENEKTRKFGFTTLSTFGLLKDRSHDWIVAVLRALLAAGWIDLTLGDHPVPFVTPAGLAVMKGATPARFVLPREEVRARKSKSRVRTEAPAMDATAAPIFERLRACRATIAKERGVPPYVVALDRTLVEMATAKPRTAAELLGVYGMGPSRVDQYGDRLLRALEG